MQCVSVQMDKSTRKRTSGQVAQVYPQAGEVGVRVRLRLEAMQAHAVCCGGVACRMRCDGCEGVMGRSVLGVAASSGLAPGRSSGAEATTVVPHCGMASPRES